MHRKIKWFMVVVRFVKYCTAMFELSNVEVIEI